jgi:uncharacterized protein YutE (UPF0331/DUF86 family)
VVDRDLILLKAGSLNKYLERVRVKSDTNLDTFLTELDRQESIMFNLQQAVQRCIDIAAHIVSEEGYGVPGSTSEMFYLLEDNGIIEKALTEKMVQAIGFRNLIAHEYEKIDVGRVFLTARENAQDLVVFIQAVFKKLGIAGS